MSMLSRTMEQQLDSFSLAQNPINGHKDSLDDQWQHDNTWKSALYRHRCHRVAAPVERANRKTRIGLWIDFTVLRFCTFSSLLADIHAIPRKTSLKA